MKAIWFFIKNIYFSSKSISMHVLRNLGKGGGLVLETAGDIMSVCLALLATLLLVSGAVLTTAAHVLKSDNYAGKEIYERGPTIDIQCEPQSN